MTVSSPPFVCHACRACYRVRDGRKLQGAARSVCRKCGTRFVFFYGPEEDDGEQGAVAALAGPGSQAPTAASGSAPGAEGAAQRFAFHGRGGSLFGIHVVNILRTMLSLGVYYFWGKVRVRRYLFSETEFAGDRFAYHGTGKELLIGFLKALLVFGVPYGVLHFAPDLLNARTGVRVAAAGLATAVLLVFVSVAMVSARRYRLSRASWRGIRFSFRGRTLDFVKLFLKGALITVVTLGAYYPFFQTRLQDFLVSHAYFGTQRFRFDGPGWELASGFLLALLLLPFTFGLSWIWFLASKQRYFWEHTSFEEARFRCTVTGRRLLNLKGENFFLLLLTLGFAWPWVTVRNMRFITENVTLEGRVDLDGIRQDPRAAASTGEGLAEFLDTGFDLG